jgi:hypothetical protein
MTLYFVVRTDVSKDSGSQRVFDALDTAEEAEARRAYLASRMIGTFRVFQGQEI